MHWFDGSISVGFLRRSTESRRGLILQIIDPLLYGLEATEENGIHETTPTHAYSETPVHTAVEELNFRCPRGTVSLGVCETIALVDRLGRVNRIDARPADQAAETAGDDHGQGMGWRVAVGSGEELFRGFVGHEVDCCTECIAH